MATFKIKRGLDIKLVGAAELVIKEAFTERYAVKPTDFRGLTPKLLVEEGTKVRAGTPLFFDKYNEKIIITSPVSGEVTAIVRGEKRRIEEIRIASEQQIEYVEFEKNDPKTLSREQIVERMLESGVWAMLRQRPYGCIANPDDAPKAIFVSAFDTAPLAPDYDLIAHGQGVAFQTGLDALATLTKGKVHLNLQSGNAGVSHVFLNAKNVEINYFKGGHPAGNVGTQINKLDPVNKGEVVWYLRVQEVITIGKLFLEGRFDATRIIAFVGSEVRRPHYFRTRIGASVRKPAEIAGIFDDNVRYISGNVLTGTNIGADGYLGFYDNQITVIPEGNHYELFGWMMPRLGKFSAWHSYLSWLMPWKKYKLDTNLNGGQRAFVFNGKYEQVFPFDIYPVQLIKAAITEDIDMMENLGIYELEEEDVALCEFICPSKIEWQAELRKGLDLIKKEMS
ncbi:MAG: Na(+)-translocating NADH-quinone reductase subunit A [Bacteroidales bacterium]|nr:Na(+)-translocating NADH-quinone reductase subunit A [Bacteroidales bacterium]